MELSPLRSAQQLSVRWLLSCMGTKLDPVVPHLEETARFPPI